MGRSIAAPVHKGEGVEEIHTSLGPIVRRELVADDGDFGGGDLDAVEAVIFVEVEHDFEVGGCDAEAVVGFAVCGGDRACGLDGDRAGREFLRNQDWKSLRATFGPVVYAREHGV